MVGLVLLPHHARCRHLDLHLVGQSAFALNNFVTLPPGSLKSLQSLVLEGLDEVDFAQEGQPLGQPVITAFRNSPQLRRLTTSALEFMFSYDSEASIPHFDTAVLPWIGITHLMITNFIRVDIFVIALAECAALQFLRVSLDLEDDVEYPNMGQWLPQDPVILTNLTEFRVSLSEGLCFPPLMNVFTFPALRHLHIQRIEAHHLHSSDPFSWKHSRLFLYKIHGIQALTLVGRVGVEEEVLTLLRNTPQVTNLSLDIWTKYQFLIPALFPPSDSLPADHALSRPLKRMTHLSVRLEGRDFPFPSHLIRDAVDSAQHSLTHLVVVVHRGYPRRLREIRDVLFYSPLQQKFGSPGGPICKSMRITTDEHLIADPSTSLDYTMFSPFVVKYI